MDEISKIRKKLACHEIDQYQIDRKAEEVSEACANLSNLCSAFSALQEIDEKIMPDPDEFIEMKNKIFEAIKNNIEAL